MGELVSRNITARWVQHLFKGVSDKGGKPYHEHCERVAAYLGDIEDDVWHAAMLHDVLEDTDTAAADLRERGYSERTIRLVQQLSRNENAGGTYQEWVAAIAASGDRELVCIKLADIQDNLAPGRRMQIGLSAIQRYAHARETLEAALSTPSSGVRP